MNIENNIVEGSNNCELSVILKFDAILLIRDILKKTSGSARIDKKGITEANENASKIPLAIKSINSKNSCFLLLKLR